MPNNNFYIVKVALPATAKPCFDYLPPYPIPEKHLLPIGSRVKVPFGKRTLIGFIIEILDETTIAKDKLKPILEVIDLEPIFSASFFKLITWVSKYYQYPINQVIKTALPKYLRDGKVIAESKLTISNALVSATPTANLQLNAAQQHAIDCVSSNLQQFTTFLLHGVTGSGKTEVYLQLVQRVIANNKQVLVLIPEIGLTPQTLARFQARFKQPIAVLHSQLTTKERAKVWLQAKSGAVQIILGTRSAAFVPLQNPGLYIIDEEHDPSFKQQVNLRYSARDLLIRRAQLENCPILLGSATPALESLHNANINKYKYLPLAARAGDANPPTLQILDIRHKRLQQGLSAQLLTAITKNLEDNGQTLIFINRRGYAPVLICHACGWTQSCKHCSAKMTIHYYPRPQIVCHHCQAKHALPTSCPECAHTDLKPLGLGTEQLEEVLATHFPGANIARIDKDVTQKKHNLRKIIDQIHSGKINIILGTQMLAKGHHFPNITLVAILDIDSALFSADFRATERMGQLITQVAGRAGREHRPGHVLLQTHHPDHPLLQLLLSAGYPKFCAALFTERRAANLPPFSYQILLRSQAKTLPKALALLAAIKAAAKKFSTAVSTLEIFGPVPAPMEKRIGVFRAQLLLQAPSRGLLQNLCQQLTPMIDSLPQAKGVYWSIDVDPIELY